jgi:nicotinamidase-related amidase
MNALVLIDLQNDYFPGGKMELVGSEPAGENAARLLSSFREAELPIFHIQHISTRHGSTFFLPNTSGVNFYASVSPLGDEIVITKKYPNAFRETALLHQLRGLKIDSLIIAGMMTHMCIDTTVRAAYDLGFNCIVAHDACTARNLIFGDETVPAHHVQVAYMASLSGIFAKIENTEIICRGL